PHSPHRPPQTSNLLAYTTLFRSSIDAAGVWTYTMDSAHDGFAAGGDYTDSITVATADGATQLITVTMHGTDDATVITGTATAELTETNTSQLQAHNQTATDPHLS